jgi:hypothetical protein
VSYFATISGADLAGECVPGVVLVPVERAQEYVSHLELRIAELDGSPVYFCDDGESGTSTNFVVAAEDAALDSERLDNTAMLALLQLCERRRCVLRVWWASDSDFTDVTNCSSVAESVRLILDRAHRRWGLRYAA